MTFTQQYRTIRLHARRAVAPLRITPTFVILGTMRGGTTSLYKYLSDHPQILPAFTKEVHYFTNHYDQSWDWYLAHFPVRPPLGLRREHVITGEGSPYYVCHPDAARRVRRHLPDARLLLLLRHPVDRAYSHYRLQRQRGREDRSFEEALELEEERLSGLTERLLADERYVSADHRNFSYKGRSRYAEQLERWFEQFPREQFLIRSSEEFYARPAAVMAEVCEFIGVRPWQVPEYKQ